MDSGYLIAGRVGKMVIYGNNRRCYSVFLFFINQTLACYYVLLGMNGGGSQEKIDYWTSTGQQTVTTLSCAE